MLACTRRETIRLVLTRCPSTPASVHSVSKLLSNPTKFQLVRTARTRIRPKETFLEAASRSDEVLLKKLEAQLERAKARALKEDEEAAKLLQWQARERNGQDEGMDLEATHKFFWDKVLTKQDRADLGSHNIYTFDDLFKSYQATMEILLTRPGVSVDDLTPRLRYAHEVYESIPRRVADAKPSKSKSKPSSFFGKFF